MTIKTQNGMEHVYSSRKQFRDITQYFHFADQSKSCELKNMQDFTTPAKTEIYCQQFGIIHKFWSIAKRIFLFHCFHNEEQFFKEPVKFGYKMWMLCSADSFFSVLKCTAVKIPI